MGCALCPGFTSLVCSGLKAEGVVIWGALVEGQCPERGQWPDGQQTQAPLREVSLPSAGIKGPAVPRFLLVLKHTKSPLHSEGNSAESQGLFLSFFFF